jgi:DNA-binding beta-propeller fold protein YncE
MAFPLKKSFWVAITLIMGGLAVLMLLQLTRAMAADVQITASAKQADVSRQTNAVSSNIGQYVYVVNSPKSNFSVITPDGITYTDLLTGELGTEGGQRLDMVITPDGQKAAITNFGDSAVFLIDISNPIAPSLITSVTTPMFAEDMAVTADGKYILVTDGGFSPIIVTIDIASATIKSIYTETVGSDVIVYANAVDISPAGTVVVADYFQGRLHTLLMDSEGKLTYANSYTVTYPTAEGFDPNIALGRPVNVAIAPDQQTVLVCNANTSTMPIYQIIAPGVLTITDLVTDVHGTFPDGAEKTSAGSQSVAFNEEGTIAYVHVNSVGYTIGATDFNTGTLGVLSITGPGKAVRLPASGLLLPPSGSSQLFGVDTMVVANNKLYIGYPTVSGAPDPSSVTVVDLTDYSIVEILKLPVEFYIPTGMAAIPIQKLFLPQVYKAGP